MEYSATTASLSIGGAVFLLPHFVIGLVCLVFGMRGKTILRGVTSKLGLVVQLPVGLLFLGVAVWSVSTRVVETQQCRTAEERGEFVSVEGPVQIVSRSTKPGNGHVDFKIGGKELRTYESGVSCDCGYVLPLGKTLRLEDGMLVQAKARGGNVISLKVKNAL